MIRKCLFAFVLVAFSVGVLSAAELTGRITKVDGDKITFQEVKFKGKGEKPEIGEAKTYTVAKDAKIMKGAFAKKGEEKGKATELTGGLTNEMFKNIDPEKGRFARITTNDSNMVTEIVVFGGGKKKKKDNSQ
jgi:hypothetical protein